MLYKKRSSVLPLEAQSSLAPARFPSNEISESPSSSGNKLVVSSKKSSSEGRRNESESNNESDVSAVRSITNKKETVKATMCCIIMSITAVTSKYGKKEPRGVERRNGMTSVLLFDQTPFRFSSSHTPVESLYLIAIAPCGHRAAIGCWVRGCLDHLTFFPLSFHLGFTLSLLCAAMYFPASQHWQIFVITTSP